MYSFLLNGEKQKEYFFEALHFIQNDNEYCFKNISEAVKKRIAGKQFYKCANKPDTELKGLDRYECPMWKYNIENPGSFDESGYDIDHIEEYCINQNNNEDNLQALCHNCHSVKTKRFITSKSSEPLTQKLSKNQTKSKKKISVNKTKISKIITKDTTNNIYCGFSFQRIKILFHMTSTKYVIMVWIISTTNAIFI